MMLSSRFVCRWSRLRRIPRAKVGHLSYRNPRTLANTPLEDRLNECIDKLEASPQKIMYMQMQTSETCLHTGGVLQKASLAVTRSNLLRRSHFCTSAAASVPLDKPKKQKKKPQGMIPWLKDQILHLWHGFHLLALNTRITLRLKKQMMSGQKPTRRERQLLEKTTRDLLRLVPFSVFVIIPGGEILLPVALKLFPNLIPSTFDTKDQRREKVVTKSLEKGVSNRRLLEHMVVQILYCERFSPDSKGMPVFRALTSTDSVLDESAIRSLSAYFDEDGPLALTKLPNYVLKDLAVVAGISGSYSAYLKRYLLPKALYKATIRYDLDQLLEFRQKDDLSLSKVNLSTLTRQEAEYECQLRGLRWYGPEHALQQQLSIWLSLSLDPDVPSHMLLFLRPHSVSAAEAFNYFSQEEIDRVLGLEEFKDTPQVMWMRSMTEQLATESQEELATESIDVDEIKQHIAEEKEELDACAKQFADLKFALTEQAHADLLTLYGNLLAKSSAKDSHGDAGVELDVLEKEFERFFIENECGCAPQRMVETFREFDIDTSGCVNPKEFETFLKRIRAG